MTNIIAQTMSKQLGKKVTNADILNSVRTIVNDPEGYGAEIPELDSLTPINHANVPYANYMARQNQFFDAFVNKICVSTFKALEFTSLSARFKKGTMTVGETWEEVLTELADPQQYNANSGISPFKFEPTKVQVMYHDINREVHYDRTFNEAWAEKAFYSEQGFDDFINTTFKSLINSDSVDETQTIKDTLTNSLVPVNIAKMGEPNNYINVRTKEFDFSNPDVVVDFASELIERSNLFAFPNRNRCENAINVPIVTPIDKQILILDTKMSSQMDMLYANTFNMDKASILAEKIVIDEFPIYQGEGDLNGAKPFAMLVSEDFLVIKDKILKMTNIFNPRDLNFNYFYHHQQMITYSLFENAILYYTMPDKDGNYTQLYQKNVASLNNQGGTNWGDNQLIAQLIGKITELENQVNEVKKVEEVKEEEVKEKEETKAVTKTTKATTKK